MKANKMSNKMFLAVMGLVTIVSITLIAIVAVMAARTQNVVSNINVSYYANNVAATVSATYQQSGDNSATTMVNGNSDNIRFYATQATTSGNLTTPNNQNLVLTAQDPYVLFTYAFTNNATRDTANNIQGYDVRITLTDTSTKNNITAKYRTDTTAPSGTLSSKYETMSHASTSLPNAVYVGAQRTVYFYVLLEITDVDYDASYASTTSAGLSWTLAHVDTQDYVDDTIPQDDTVYTVNNDGVLTGYSLQTSTDLTLPSNATSTNANLFKDNTTITSVTIPSSYTNIGQSSFYGCTNLESVVFENGSTPTSTTSKGLINNDQSSLGDATTTTIGIYAFRNCTKLATLILPNNLTAIPGYMCYMSPSSNTYLTSITIPSGVTSIGQNAFYNCRGLTSVTIGSGVTSIGGWAFANCTGLTSITIPNSVTSIGEDAFCSCSGLTGTLTIPNSVTSIGTSAFSGCSGLTSVYIQGTTSIGHNCFSGCSNLANVYFTVQDGNWYHYRTQISATDIADSALQATWMTSTYVTHGWAHGTYGDVQACCVTGDTLISMADGSQKRIDEIALGDEILSYNMETGEVEVDYVDALVVKYRDIKVTITFTDGTIIKVSDDHPLLTTLGWKSFDPEHGAQVYESIGVCDETFAIGDKMLTLKDFEGVYLAEFDKTIASIESEHYTDEPYTMYTIRVSNNHNYFSAGVLSHNPPVCG